jgi:hypothetical protein
VGSFGIFLPFMLYGLYVTIRSLPRSIQELITSPFALLFLFWGFYVGVHILTWTLVRYRLPVDATLTMFAGIALWQILRSRFKLS